MSFRIDDILKKEHKPPLVGGHLSFETGPHPWEKIPIDDSNSILQQTLLSRRYPYKQVGDLYSAKLYSSWYNCDRMYFPPNYETYIEKGKYKIYCKSTIFLSCTPPCIIKKLE